MRDGHCPKCSATEVYKCEEQGLKHALIEANSLRIYKDKRLVPDITFLGFAHYVCKQCGYFESYVLQVDQLSKLTDSDNWTRVQP